MTRQPKASIILRTKNEAAFIAQTLDRLFEQNYPNFEVIVVDSGSTDGTCEIVSEYPVKLLKLEPREFSYGRALNVGFKTGQGEFFIALSAHALPLDRDWLKNILAPFEDSRVAGVAGKALPHLDCNPFDRRGLMRRFGTDRKYLHYNSTITFSNASSAIRAGAWETEPFDEELPYSEDIKWSRSMMRKGWRFVYEPTATVFHSHNESPRQLFDRFYNQSKARTILDQFNRRYRAGSLLWDFLAGTLYDVWTAVIEHRSLKWALFAPLRRYWINLGCYFGSRGMDRNYKKNPFRLLLLRILLILIRYISQMAERLAPYLVVWTKKHTELIHPKPMLEYIPGEDWFTKFISGRDRVLDYGCGQGRNLFPLSRIANHVCGVENDIKSLNTANFLIRWKEVRNVCLIAGDYKSNPFSANTFDLILALNPFSQVYDKDIILSEIYGMLKPEGMLIISVLNRDTPWKNLQEQAGLPAEFRYNGDIGYTKNELETELGRFGFHLSANHPESIDSPLNPLIDVFGGISIGAYKWLLEWRHKKAVQHPDRSSELRLVFTKAELK